MILSGNTIRKLNIINPFVEKGTIRGRSYGVSHASYDIRIAQTAYLEPGEFHLFSSIEEFNMPKNVCGTIHDKSSWARRGLSVFNTLIDPGWKGFLTLELVNNGYERLRLTEGDPIAQLKFEYLDEEVSGYTGKYQLQEAGPQEARYEV